MTQNEFFKETPLDVCLEEMLSTLHSVQGLLILIERYHNHQETYNYLNLISRSLFRMESQINQSIKKINV